MTQPNLPPPMVPAAVDLRDFGFMPLDVLRLRDSDLAALATGDEFKAAVLLWCVAWHQVPAGSLPDDDRLLARYSGAGATWKKVREEALRGFTRCSDGRLYHQVISGKAREAWESKLAQRARTKAATEAREKKRREAESARDEQRDVRRNVERDEQRDVARDVVQGIGTVKGQGQGREREEGESAQPPAAAAAAPPPSRGSRLPAGWVPEPVHMAFAEGIGLRNGKALAELEKFRDYWTAQPGQKGVKTDWPATWRNWVRRAVDDAAAKGGKPGGDNLFDGAH